MITAYEYGMRLMSRNVDPGTIVAFLALEAGAK